jgi:hypothetical protein
VTCALPGAPKKEAGIVPTGIVPAFVIAWKL